MSDKEKQKSIIEESGGFLRGMGDYFRLVLRLMADARVSPLLKLLPIGTLVYLINPVDIPGPIDDVGVIGLGLYMFVEMCPVDIVEEHRQALQGVVTTTARDPDGKPGQSSDEEIVDAEFREEK